MPFYVLKGKRYEFMKVKKWLLGLVTFAAMVVLCVVCAGAETYGDFVYIESDNKVTIVGYNGDLKDVNIPEKINGISVTAIGVEAFKSLKSITSITMPNSVTYIGDSAFEGCSNITSVKLPDSVEYIGESVFRDCSNLTDITLPKNITWIPSETFSGCTNLTSIILPEGVTAIGTYAFTYCTSLKSISIPNGVTSIGGKAFSNCTSLTDIIMPDSLTYINPWTFSDCTNLTNITIPDSVTSIDGYTFSGCTSLTSITIPNSVTSVGPCVFSGCTSLANITISNSVTSIGNGAFSDCSSLTSITIPDGVTGISDGTFNGCTSLTSITIPDSVTSIGDRAFNGCTSLTSITIPDGVTGIEDYTFSGCTSLKSLMIPESVVKIGDYAFDECSSLTGITIPKSVTEVGKSAFRNCSNLTNITIQDGVESIGDYAFDGCKKLKEINVAPNNKKYTSVSGILFDKSKKELLRYPAGKVDKSYNIPDSVTSIGDLAFEGCSSIESITITDNVINIGISAFVECLKLSKIDIETDSKNFVSVNGVLFNKNQTELICYPAGKTDISYNIPDSVTSIGWNAFNSCKNLTSINLPNSVTNIGNSAFSDCTNLVNINIPGSVTDIGGWAFYNCNSLNAVTIPICVETIGWFAFGFEDSGKHSDFKIYCYGGTAVSYAIDNGLEYELLNCTEHKFGAWSIIQSATCTAEGTQTRTCSACGKVETATIAKTAHQYVDTVVKPTYTTKGYTLHKCSVCGTSYKDTYTAKLTLTKVTGAKLGGRAADALRINWTKNASADGYIVEMYQGNKWVRVAKITSNNTTTFRKAGLKAGTAYKFRVRAYKMSGKTAVYGAYSATVAARTNPSVIKGAKLTGRAADALRINWTKNASADGYIVEKHQGNKWVRVAKITNNSMTTFRKAGLKASTVYKFRVRAYKMSGKTALYGNYSATVTARTNPSVMKGVKIGGKAKNALRVNWAKNASAQGYIVEMYKGGKWVRVAKITNSNTTTFRKAGLARNTTYKFRVRAYHMSGKTALYGNYGSVSGKTAAK